jgi:predicted membrane channel-forming protein YqfA (hemolysin III family)
MEPGEALGIAAQIAVALAGFAGVVVVFRCEAVHEWSDIDKLRLRFLLANSMLPLGLSMLGLVLVSIEPEPPGIWRWCSGILLVATMWFVMATGKTFRRLNLQNPQRKRITRFVFYLFGGFGTAALLLQLYNIASLAAFWPFFAGIVYQLVSAMAQFARMILLLPE